MVRLPLALLLTLVLLGTNMSATAFAEEAKTPPPKVAETTDAPPTAKLDTPKAKTSYAIGVDIGRVAKRNLDRSDAELDLDLILRGIADTLKGNKPALSPTVVRATLQKFFTEMQQKQVAKRKVIGDKNLKAGKTFLAANSKKPSIVSLPSGVQYKILKPGTGKKPTKTSSIVVHYRGAFITGKTFEQTTPGQPITLQMNGQRRPIEGWQEVLPLMGEGAKWSVYIPAHLAYGERGTDTIPPNSALIFDIELVKVK